MRKIVRSRVMIPGPLREEEAQAAKVAVSAYYRILAEDRAKRRAPLNPNIWNSEPVREALYRLFISKCAYCESPLDEDQQGDISHYRPTANAIDLKNRNSDSSSSDHYSWLAYEWENLFLSCVECNRSKRNLFPLDGPRASLRCTWSEAEISERALLVNPCVSDPKKHLRFLMDGQVQGIDKIGRATIDVLALDRQDLIFARVRQFEKCLMALERGRDNRSFEEFQRQLTDDAPFVGAARIVFFNLALEFSTIVNFPKPSFRNIAEDMIRIAIIADAEQWLRLRKLMESSASGFFESVAVEVGYASEGLRSLWRPRTAQLRRVIIRNFKGIDSLQLEFSSARLNEVGASSMIILGENSTGKSTTLQAIALTLMGDKMRSRMGVSAEDFLPREVAGWQLDYTAIPQVVLEFDAGDPVNLQVDPLTKMFIGNEHPTMVLYAFGSRRFFGSEIARRQPASTLKSLFDPFAKLHHPGNWLRGLSEHEFSAVARAMREVLVLQEEDSIERDQEGRLFVRAHGRDTPLEKLSDGYRSLMAMVLDVMRGMLEAWGDLENARGLVLIDEVEIHLHPRWKLRVMSALRSAMPNVQFIATTHDPLCLRGMREGEVQVLVRNEEQQIQVLSGLPDVRGLRAEQLLTSDYFGLSSTADPDVEKALERLALPVQFRRGAEDMNEEALQAFQWLGDTPVEQIVNEAMRRFISEGSSSREIDRGRVRETVVNDVLNRLHAIRLGRHE